MGRIDVSAHDQTTAVAVVGGAGTATQVSRSAHTNGTSLRGRTVQSSGVPIDVQCRYAAKTRPPGAASAVPRAAPANHHNKGRIKIQLAPANLPWCSDRALEMLADLSTRYEAPMHMHFVETAYQEEYAHRRGGGAALDYIDRFGFLGPRLTLRHGLWPRSGVAPLNAFEKRRINTAIGLDKAASQRPPWHPRGWAKAMISASNA